MSRWRGSRKKILLIMVLFSLLAFEAGAKKRRKHRHRSRPAPAPAESSAVVAQTAPAQLPAVVDAAQGSQQCEAEKAQLQQVAQQHSDMNKEVVGKHNKLVSEYNTLLRSHSELIKRFNQLVHELEDPSVANFLAAKAIKVYHHPGIEGAVNKTYIHVLPAAQQALMNGQLRGVEWFNKTQSKVQNFLQAYGGDEDWVPTMSGFIVYGSVLIPVSVACWCVLEFVCKLNQIILFGHVYLAAFAISLACVAISTGDDPLSTFAEQDSTLYQFAQCAFALIFFLYGVVSTLAWCLTTNDNSWRCIHLGVILCFGAAYYMLIWTPAMLDELPKVEDIVEWILRPDTGKDAPDPPRFLVAAPYIVVACVFSTLFVAESYSRKGSGSEDKEGPKAQ